jgi:hypothetical protein
MESDLIMEQKVHYSLLNDAEYYFKNFNRKECENWTEDEFKKVFKEKYESMLPIDLLTWCRVNEPEDKMIYKQGYWEQIIFVRDRLPNIWYEGGKDTCDSIRYNINVISTHRSKSIELPVYEIRIPRYNLVFTMRDNFYDWKISVESKQLLDLDFMNLFDQDEKINSIYCEGFPENRVYISYNDSINNKWRKNFTVSINSDYKLYMFIALIVNFLRKYN